MIFIPLGRGFKISNSKFKLRLTHLQDTNQTGIQLRQHQKATLVELSFGIPVCD